MKALDAAGKLPMLKGNRFILRAVGGGDGAATLQALTVGYVTQLPGPDGKPAETHFLPLESTAGGSLVRAMPATGRTHQIRVHLAHLGMPLLGDRLYEGPMYWGDEDRVAVNRAMLHALALQIPHPKTGEPVDLMAPPPPDFVGLAERMGNWEINVERCLKS